AERVNDDQLACAISARRPFDDDGVGEVKADGAVNVIAQVGRDLLKREVIFLEIVNLSRLEPVGVTFKQRVDRNFDLRLFLRQRRRNEDQQQQGSAQGESTGVSHSYLLKVR